LRRIEKRHPHQLRRLLQTIWTIADTVRSPIKCRMQLGVQDTKGGDVQLECHGRDMSGAGALVLSPARIFAGAVVSTQCKELQLMGNATVRHCTEQNESFWIGVEFRGWLTRTF
jgi:hypothetical protein